MWYRSGQGAKRMDLWGSDSGGGLDDPPVAVPTPPQRSGSGLRRWFSSAVAVLLKFKFLLAFGSLIVAMLAYGLTFGWAFGVGLVLLIAVHEAGHVVAIRQRGLQASLPIFIPFMGAVVGLRQQPRDAAEEAYIGIAGPVFGLAASVLCWWLGSLWRNDLLLVLASFGMLMHIFNLMPIVPLDGGRTVAFLRWKAWGPGLVAMLILLFFNPRTGALTFDPLALLILVFILYNFRARLANPPSPIYDQISPGAKWFYGGLWFCLLALSVIGYLTIPLGVRV